MEKNERTKVLWKKTLISMSQTFQSWKKLKDNNKLHFSVTGVYHRPTINDFNCNYPQKYKDYLYIAALFEEVNTRRKRLSSNKRQYTRYYKFMQ